MFVPPTSIPMCMVVSLRFRCDWSVGERSATDVSTGSSAWISVHPMPRTQAELARDDVQDHRQQERGEPGIPHVAK